MSAVALAPSILAASAEGQVLVVVSSSILCIALEPGDEVGAVAPVTQRSLARCVDLGLSGRCIAALEVTVLVGRSIS